MDYQQKKEQALKDLECGYNCAQSVLRQFSQEYGLQKELSTRIASGFGGGLRMAKTCGAVSGAIMTIGLMYGFENAEELARREKINRITIQFLDWFKQKFGTTECKDLLGIDVTLPGNRQIAEESGIMERMCPDCIGTAIDIISEIVEP